MNKTNLFKNSNTRPPAKDGQNNEKLNPAEFYEK